MDRFIDRTEEFERRLADLDAVAAALAPGPNMYYLSGFAGEADRHTLLLVTEAGKRTFVCAEQYTEQAADASWMGDVRAVAANDPAQIVEGFLQTWGETEGRLLVDDAMPMELGHRLETAVESTGLASDVLASMRMEKDAAETAALRRSAAVADEVSEEIRAYGSDAVGMTESELAAHVRARLHAKGCTDLSFPVVVAAGPNGARPTQYRHGDREIRPGEPVVLDFGGVLDHYASDQTRVVVFEGDPPAEFTDAYEAVRSAFETGVDEIEPGMTAGEADALVREVIADHGYDGAFTTGTGHGVGLRAHEPPAIEPGAETTLREGMVFSVEPGVYLEGRFGVRLETLVVATTDGVEPLNASPLTWRPL